MITNAILGIPSQPLTRGDYCPMSPRMDGATEALAMVSNKYRTAQENHFHTRAPWRRRALLTKIFVVGVFF